MDDQHLTRDLLEAMAEGGPVPEALLRHMTRHLVEMCPQCRGGYRDFVTRATRSGKPTPDAAPTLAVLGRWNRDLAELRRAGEEDFAELIALPRGERRERLCRSPRRFRSPLLAELLLEESRKRLLAEPVEAHELAQLAIDAALRIDARSLGSDLPTELVVRATAHRANALRVLGDLLTADLVIGSTLPRVAELHDPLTRAEILSLAASLRRDQRRFEEALRLLDRAAALYRLAGDRHLEGRVLVKRGLVLGTAGEPERAMEAARRSLSALDSQRDPALFACAHLNLALYTCDAGHHAEARDLLEASAPLHHHLPDPWNRNRIRWLEGKIAFGLGQADAAERALLEARAGFQREKAAFDAALSALDLLMLYAEQERADDVRRMAIEVHATFGAQRVHREALAALAFLRRAAEREAVTARLVRDLTAYLEAARRDPLLEFRRPG